MSYSRIYSNWFFVYVHYCIRHTSARGFYATTTIRLASRNSNNTTMNEHHLSDDEENGEVEFLTKQVGFSRKRRGWVGDHMEFEREKPLEGDTAHAAVDLEQFRNRQVGVGYQAKHVVRQRSAPESTVVIRDMTKDKNESKMKKRELCSSSKKAKTDIAPKSRLQIYLGCESLRTFRKELSSIE
jgi:hypothetical protein